LRFLVIGSGGREHALCWKLRQSPLCDRLYCAPGNAGIAEVAECVAIKAMDFAGIAAFAKANQIDLVVVGPEDPLAGGLVDILTENGVKAFGPSKAAAQLEASKGFVKDLCAEHSIPTAAYRRFRDAAPAQAYLETLSPPFVVKADGLAAGKGVIVAQTRNEARDAVTELLGGRFGEAGSSIVIEEFLQGEEASFFVLSDGKDIAALPSAQDHKRAFDGDEGPNTGGMGAYSPAPIMSEAVVSQTLARIVEPTIAAMAKRGAPFKGVLFAGLMIDANGPKLIEFNARFGDPECQTLMLRWESDLAEACLAVAEGTLKSHKLRWSGDAALTVVLATKGYPGDYLKNTPIGPLDAARKTPGVEIFHAGTARGGDGGLVSYGGRVLNVSARAPTLRQARDRAYQAAAAIDWPLGYYRRDIGWRAI
jgi:phosphoribosylamine--glycine ligase